MAFGHDLEAVSDDGVTIYYNIISSTNKIVEVTYKDDDPKLFTDRYSGRISIPETVSYEGTTYSVLGIDESSFYRCEVKSMSPNSVTSIGMGAFDE